MFSHSNVSVGNTLTGELRGCLNLLKPTGHVMYQHLLYSTVVNSAHNALMFYIHLGTAISASYSLN